MALPDGETLGLEAVGSWGANPPAFPNGAQAAEVEIGNSRQRLIDAEIARLDQELQRRQAENLQARSDRAGDPAERARLAAEAATADARRQYAELQRDTATLATNAIQKVLEG